MTGVSGVKSRKLWEVMDHVTVTNHADIEFIVLVNEKFWQGLPEDTRKVISAAALKAEMTVRDKVSEIEKNAYAAASENGMTVYIPTAEEVTAWKQTAQPVIDGYKAASGELGAQVLQAAQSLQ